MCLAGPRYTHDLRARLLQLMDERGVTSWKLDGFVYRRATCEDSSHGHPTGKNGKYYETAWVENWIDVLHEMRQHDLDVFITITCWTWASPWWLQHVDTVWLNNATDQGWFGEGDDRQRQLTYRDSRVYQLEKANGLPFPLWGLFHLDPIKGLRGNSPVTGKWGEHITEETSEEFRRAMYMIMARGSQLCEMYLAPSVLTDKDWDALADVLTWARANRDPLAHMRIVGGDPAAREAYGYSGWTPKRGVLVLRNPCTQPRTFRCKLDSSIGVVPGSGPFRRQSILAAEKTNAGTFAFGTPISITLPPYGIVVWDFAPSSPTVGNNP